MPAKPLTHSQLADAERLRNLFSAWQYKRKERGQPASQDAAAAELGFGQSAFSQYLRGKIPLNGAVLMKFANLLGCRLEEISPTLEQELRTFGQFVSKHTSDHGNSENTQQNGVKIKRNPPAPQGTLQNSKLDKKNLTDGRASVSVRPILAWDNPDDLGEEYVLIPRLDVKFSAGNGKIAWHVDEKGQKQAFRRAWCQRLGINPDHAATVVNEGQSMEPRLIDGDSLVVDYKVKNVIDGKVYAIAYQNELYVKRLFKQPDGGLIVRSDNPDKTRFPDMDLSPAQALHVEVIARVMGVSGAV